MKFSFLDQLGLFGKLGLSLLIAAWLVFAVNFIGNQLVPKDAGAPSAATKTAAPGPEKKAEPEPKAEPKTETKAKAPEKVAEKAPEETKQAPASGLAALLAAADPGKGAKLFRKCKACHTVNKGGRNTVGPNLWEVVGRAKAGGEGFRYSSALKRLGGTWSYADLDGFLTKPKAFVRGTKMSMSGIKKAADRADLIAYLRALSDSPKPLP